MLPLAPSLLLALGLVKYRDAFKPNDTASFIRDALAPAAGIAPKPPKRRKTHLRVVK